MTSAAEHWKKLADIASSQYYPQYLARNNYIDWQALVPRVLEDIEIARGTLKTENFGVSPRTNNLGR